MNDPKTERPRVAKVVVTVRSGVITPPSFRSEIQVIAKEPIDEGNFNFYPKLYLTQSEHFTIPVGQDKIFPGNNDVIYRFNTIVFENPGVEEIAIDPKRDNDLDQACFEYIIIPATD